MRNSRSATPTAVSGGALRAWATAAALTTAATTRKAAMIALRARMLLCSDAARPILSPRAGPGRETIPPYLTSGD
jgi:hypothetical protein